MQMSGSLFLVSSSGLFSFSLFFFVYSSNSNALVFLYFIVFYLFVCLFVLFSLLYLRNSNKTQKGNGSQWHRMWEELKGEWKT
jgi:Ca2+/Na+ antiporter